MAEESWNRGTDGTGCQAPENHRLCANNCGFFGSPATHHLCSKCYRDFCLKEEQAASAKAAVEKSLSTTPTASSFCESSTTASVASVVSTHAIALTDETSKQAAAEVLSPIVAAAADPPPQQPPNKCFVCRKRVGLTGFRCRCESTFCSSHRYPEQHNCKFDFKSAGREALAKANPVVKAEKLDKI